VYCPRCGAQSEEGAKYCSACGATLPGTGAKPPGRRPLRERIGRLAGTSRRTRLLSVGTVAAIAIAIAALVALPTDENAVPQDAYTRVADAVCVHEKERIVAAQRRALKAGGSGLGRYADELVLVAAEWRSSVASTPAPPDRQDHVRTLDSALRAVEVEAGALARIARDAGRKAAIARAARLDIATGQVEGAISALGLDRCSHLAVGTGGLVRR